MSKVTAWFRLFRIVNLPTVPGDLFVGASAVLWGAAGSSAPTIGTNLGALVFAALGGCAIYLFGLVDNDITDASKDGTERPIPAGEISLFSARVARGLCLFAALVFGSVGNLPPVWWLTVSALLVVIVLYNRTKWPLAMGLCRGLNVLAGGAALVVGNLGGVPSESRLALVVVVVVWTVYTAALTWYSAGEHLDAAKKRRVGLLVGAFVYLQLLALLFFGVTRLMLLGAALLIVLRLIKRILPEVSAS